MPTVEPVRCINQTLPTPDPAVIYRAMPDGAVLFSPQNETYFGLDPVGAFIWEHLTPVCDSLQGLCEAVGLQYPDVEPGVIWQDVIEFLESLQQSGLIREA